MRGMRPERDVQRMKAKTACSWCGKEVKSNTVGCFECVIEGTIQNE